ncbi:MAG: alpha/beta hydrolase [Breznakia sp.]
MKKRTKIILGIITSFIVVCLITLGCISNYFYNLALDPNTDKSIIFDNEATENKESLAVEDTFFSDTKHQDRYIINDGLKLYAYDFNQKSDTYVIVVHGYAGEASEMSVSAKHFYEMGYNVLTPDLRGHGKSEGDYIGMGWDDRLDIVSWIDDLLKEDKEYNIILYGVSMGGATVMNTTGETLPSNVKLAIEDCGYTSTWDIFSYQLKALFSLPSMPFMDAANVVVKFRAGYNLKDGAIDQVTKSKTPTLFIHGDEDAFVPFSMLDEVYKACRAPKEKLVVKGAGHAQSHLIEKEIYWKTVDDFIAKYR